MPPLLSPQDARQLAAPDKPELRGRLCAWAIFVLGVGILIPVIALDQAGACHELAPCGPDPLAAAGAGLFVAAWFLGFLSVWAAAITAAAATAAALTWDLTQPAREMTPGTWILAGYTVAVVLLAWISVSDSYRTGIASWASAQSQSRLPGLGLAAVPKRGKAQIVFGVTLIVLSVAVAGFAAVRQRAADDQMAEAQIVQALVDKKIDDFTIAVTIPGAEPASLSVVDAANYQPGQTVSLALDDRGLKQLVAEPYDASGWFFIAMFVLAFGLCFIWRGLLRRQERLRLAGTDQPSVSVLVLGLDLYAGSARPGELPFAGFRPVQTIDGGIRPELPNDDDWDDGDDSEDADVPVEPPRFVDLYGNPALKQECLLHDPADGSVLIGEIQKPFGRLPLPSHDLRHTWIEANILPPQEVASAPEAVHVHRKPALIGHLLTVPMPFALVHVFQVPEPMPALVVWPLAAGITTLAYLFGWKLWIRPAIAWNAGGISGFSPLRRYSYSWADVTRIELDGSTIIISTSDNRLCSISAQARSGGRTGESLRAGLEHARSRYTPTILPPPAPKRRWPLGLLVALPVVSGILVWFNTI